MLHLYSPRQHSPVFVRITYNNNVVRIDATISNFPKIQTCDDHSILSHRCSNQSEPHIDRSNLSSFLPGKLLVPPATFSFLDAIHFTKMFQISIFHIFHITIKRKQGDHLPKHLTDHRRAWGGPELSAGHSAVIPFCCNVWLNIASAFPWAGLM
jgi:hypothetical protein